MRPENVSTVRIRSAIEEAFHGSSDTTVADSGGHRADGRLSCQCHHRRFRADPVSGLAGAFVGPMLLSVLKFDLGIRSPLVSQFFDAVNSAGNGELDHSALLTIFEGLAGHVVGSNE